MKTFQTTQEIRLILRFFLCAIFYFFFHQMIKKIKKKKRHACTAVESFVNISNSAFKMKC